MAAIEGRSRYISFRYGCVGYQRVKKGIRNKRLGCGRQITGSKNPNSVRKLNIKNFRKYFYEELMPAWGGPPPNPRYLEELIDYYGG